MDQNAELKRILIERFGASQLRELARRVGVDYESLAATTEGEKCPVSR